MSQPDTSFPVPPVTQAAGGRSWWWRWGFPIGVAVFWCGVVGFAQNSEGIDAAIRFLITAACTLLCVILGIAWAVYRFPLSSQHRKATLAVLLASGVGLLLAVRIDGVDGDMRPQLAWRWKPKPNAGLAEAPALAVSDVKPAAIDLTQGSDHDYPQFLGPARNATFAGPNLARDWVARPPRELWRMPIGAGWSSFAVVGNYAITQEQRGLQELVVCYELATGNVVWSRADDVRHETSLGGVGPRATPTIDAGRVYTMGANGLLNCLNGSDGELLWQHQVYGPTAVVPNWGKSCSPLVVNDLVVISAGDGMGKSVIAYDKVSGKQAWAAGDDASSYSSPLLTTLAGRAQIIMVNQHSVTAHVPESGEILWDHAWPGETPKVPQPMPVDPSQLLISAGYGLGYQLLTLTADGDQLKVADPPIAFNTMKPKFTNPVIVGEHLYGLDDGVLACVEWKTGKRKWRRGRYGHGQVLLVGNLLLVQAEAGELLLVEANPTAHKELTSYPALSSISWNVPTLVGNLLLVRNDREAVALELPLAE